MDRTHSSAAPDHDETTPSTRNNESTSGDKALKAWSKKLWCRVQASKLREFSYHRGLNVIFACFLVKRIGFTSESLTFQYTSEILHKKLYQTVWLRILNALGATFALGLFLPLIVQSSALRTPEKDIWVIRGSLIDLIVGFLTLWQGKNFVTLCIGMFKTLAPFISNQMSPLGMGICGLGEGLEPGLQSFGSYIVGKANNATFFTFASLLGVAGELLGSPIMAWSYTIRGADHLPAGFCFLFSAVRIHRAPICTIN